MINMMKADAYKMVRSKAFYIGILMMLFTIGLAVYSIEPVSIGLIAESDLYSNESFLSQVNDMTREEVYDMSISVMRKIIMNSEGYEFDRDCIAVNINLYYIFIFVAVITIAGDFSNSSVKNTLSSAISRRKYFLSKMIFNALVCSLLLIAHNYILHFGNILFNGNSVSSSLKNVTGMTLIQLPVIITLSVILSGLAFTAKRTAVFNTISIPFIMVFQLLLSLFAATFKIKEKYLDYELQMMISKLVHDPSVTYIRNAFVTCALLIVGFSVLGWLAFRKSEIK